jgi:hypothetical protein
MAFGRIMAGGFAVAVGLAPMCPASAQSTIMGPTAYVGGTPVTLNIPVTASVGGRCGFATSAAPSGSFDAGEIDRTSWSGQFPFHVELQWRRPRCGGFGKWRTSHCTDAA